MIYRTSPIFIFLILLLLLVTGCSQLPAQLSQPSESLETQAATRLAQEDYAAAAQLYRLAGESASEPRRSKLLLEGADAAIQAPDPGLAEQLLDGVNPTALDARGQAAFELLRVQIRIQGKPPAQALKLLPPPSSGSPPSVAAKIWKLRAQLFARNNQTADAVHALVQRDVWLLDEGQVKANDQLIWQQLQQQPPNADTQAPAGDEITSGWLALARIDKGTRPDRSALKQELQRWERRYADHPARRQILPEQFDYKPPQTADTAGQPIGLALPLTGDFASAAAAIQDGFLAGYYASKELQSGDNALPALRIYDTNTLSDANRLIGKTRSDGIGVLVGPLQKGLATELAQRRNLGVPVLALNYVEGAVTQANFYQFGLAPEDEATAAAKRALAMGFTTAIALVPEGEWGQRVLESFRDTFNSTGGTLVDYATFNPQNQDHAQPIKRLLRYGSAPAQPVQTRDSDADERNSETSRRRDVDFIFIAAQPAQARQIRQQLRYFYAARLPVLATSHVFTGVVNPSKDGDLEDLMFADMPWIIGDSTKTRTRREQAREFWPQVDQRYPRLFAMGYDAWLLVARLNAGDLQKGFLLEGNTGDLYLRDAGRIQRELDWAQFRNGKPRALPKLQAPTPTQPVGY